MTAVQYIYNTLPYFSSQNVEYKTMPILYHIFSDQFRILPNLLLDQPVGIRKASPQMLSFRGAHPLIIVSLPISHKILKGVLPKDGGVRWKEAPLDTRGILTERFQDAAARFIGVFHIWLVRVVLRDSLLFLLVFVPWLSLVTSPSPVTLRHVDPNVDGVVA